MTTWFTSDLHIGHKLVSGLRGFWLPGQNGEPAVPDTDEHDRVLAERWDACVAPDDMVWILGDLSINSGPQVIEWVSKRPGIKNLVSGNHDKSHTAIFRKLAQGKMDEWSMLFESIQDETEIEIDGHPVTLSHFPSWDWGDGPGRGEARYEKFRPWVKDETIILHGHTHGTEKGHGREYHVGVDAHEFFPVPESTIIEWIETLD